MATGVKFSSPNSLVCVGGIISSEMLDLNCLVGPFSSVEPICSPESVCSIKPVLSMKSICSFFSKLPWIASVKDVEVTDVPKSWDTPSVGWVSTQ